MLFWNRNRSASLLTNEEEDETTWLLTQAFVNPRHKFVEDVLRSWWRRIAILYALPTFLILCYAAIPFPLYTSEIAGRVQIDFWFFLFVFYGIYNAVGLLWITKLFNLFSVNWWPQQLGGLASFFLFWSVSLAAGSLTYLVKDDWGTFTLTWSLLTLLTMLGPIVFGFFYTRRMHLARSSSREDSVAGHQKIPFLSVFEAHLPRSYTRFLWFILVLAIGLGSFALGEAYAWFWLSTLPHSSADVLLYVYTWIALIYCLDFVTSFIIERQIESPSLLFMFKLYYALTHQIYVRNLYARLRSPEQFAVIQGASSFVTVIVAPIIMHNYAHKVMVYVTGSTIELLPYRKNAARGFYLKTWAANTTMAAFLGWVTILHFGPNRPAYPYFDFSEPGASDDLYSWQLTFTASFVVWICEIISSFVARSIMQKAYDFRVDKEMQSEMTAYPDLLPGGLVLTLFVLMNMLSTSIQPHHINGANLNSVYSASVIPLTLTLSFLFVL